MRRKSRAARAQDEQLGLPLERIVARPVLRASIVHSRKPGSTKYSTGVSSTALVLACGSLQRQRFESRSVADAPFASRTTFPEDACVIGGRAADDAPTATRAASARPARSCAFVRTRTLYPLR